MSTRGIYKSTNGLLSVGLLRPATGFPAWPSLAKGKDIAIGPSTSRRCRVLAAAMVATPTERVFLWRRNEVRFNSRLGAEEVTKDRFQTFALTNSLWFIVAATTELNQDTTVLRTKDAGATWATLARPSTNDAWQAFAIDASGRVWGLTGQNVDNVNGRSKVLYSTDQGDTWILSKQEDGGVGTDRMFSHLVAHPTNDQRVAAIGDRLGSGGTNCLTLFTTDRGATWTVNDASGVFYAGNVGRRRGALQLPDNRIVMVSILLTGNNTGIVVSDNNGGSWVNKKDFGSSSFQIAIGPTGAKNGGKLYVLHIDIQASPNAHEVLESIDQGQTWQNIGNNIPIPSASYNYSGFAYDERDLAIYAFGEGGRLTNDYLLMRLQQPVATSIWADYSDTLLPIGSHTSYSTALQSSSLMAVIP